MTAQSVEYHEDVEESAGNDTSAADDEALDPVYENFKCPPHMQLRIDTVAQWKQCTITLEPRLYPGVPWGPLISTIWSGDVGYWVETVEVRSSARLFYRAMHLTVMMCADVP